MSATNRDIALNLSVTTVGTESVKQLQTEVLALAKQGGAAAPEFQKLAAEIAKLGEQAKLVETTRALGSEIERLAVIEAQASDRTTNLRTELAGLGVVIANTTASELEARNALQAAQAAIFEKRQALATLKNETTAANRESADFAAQIQNLNREIINGKTEVRALADAHREAKTQTREAATAEAELAKSVGLSARESTAQGMGITEAQLIKLVESGSLATRDFIVPLTNGLREIKGDVDGLMPTWERFRGLLTATSQGAGDAGWALLLGGALKALAVILGGVVVAIAYFSEKLFLAGAAALAFGKAVTGNRDALGFFVEHVEASNKRIDAMTGAPGQVLSPSASAADATKNLGTTVAATAGEILTAEGAVKQLAAAHTLSGAAAELAGNATLNSAGNIVKYRIEADKLLVTQEQLTAGLQTLEKAAKLEGDQLVTLAKLSGDSAQLREAEARAAGLQAVATAKVAASQQAEIDILATQRKHIEEISRARGDSAESIRAQVSEIDKKLSRGIPELEQMRQAAFAARIEAEARALATEALKDHSGTLDQYKDAVDAARAQVETLRAAEKLGTDVKAPLAAATEDLAKKTFLYNDAVSDSIKKLDLDTKLRRAQLGTIEAQAQASSQHYQQLAQEARALGDTTLATYYDIEAKKQAIKVLQIKMQIGKLENDAALIEIELRKKQIQGTDEQAKAQLKLLEIQAEILKVRNIANEAIKDQIRTIDAEITAIRNGTSARDRSSNAINTERSARESSRGAIDAQTAALEKQNAAMERNNSAIEKSIALENKRRGVDGSGFAADSSGNRIAAGGDHI